MKRIFISFSLMAILSNFAIAQEENPSLNFFETQKRLKEKLNPNNTDENGFNSKYYRWYYNWRYRLGPNGEMSTANEVYNELLQNGSIKSNRRNATSCSQNDDNINWNNRGPRSSHGSLGNAGGSFYCNNRVPNTQNQGRIESISVNPNNLNEILVGAYNGGIWRTTNGGNNWSITTDDEGYSLFGCNAIIRHPDDNNVVYASTSLGCGGWEGGRKKYSMGVIVSYDGGVSWQPTGLNYQTYGNSLSEINQIAIDPKSTLNNTILYACLKAQVKRYQGDHTAQGQWQDIHTDYSYSSGPLWWGNINYNDVIIDNNNGVWFSNLNGIYRYNGNTTYKVNSYTIPAPFNVGNTCTNIGNGIFNLRQHTNLEINKQGHIVMVIAYTDCNNYISNSGTPVGVGTKVYLYKSTNHGASWSAPVDVTGKIGAAPSAVAPNLVVDPNNSDIIYSSGMGNVTCVIKSTDFGANFSFTGNGDNHVDVRKLVAYDSGPKNTFYVATDGGISKMTDGNNWNDITGYGLSITNYYGCGISETNDKIIFGGAQDGSINFFNHGIWYETIPPGDNGDCLINPDDNKLVFQQSQNSLTRGIITGNNVSSLTGYTPPKGWMNPMHWNPVDKSEFFIGSNYLKVGKTTSTTLTNISTTLHSSNKQISSVAVSKDDPNTVYYSTDSYVWNSSAPTDDGIYKATRSGGSWTVTDITSNLKTQVHGKTGLSVPITDIAVDPNNKNRIWVTMGNFDSNKKVFFTNNGGASWSHINKNGIPNLPCTSIAFQAFSNDRLYIGTDNGIYFTDKTMTCWEKYGNNGPQCQVNDLEINQCAGKLVAATHGRGIWEAPLIVTNTEKLPVGVNIWNSTKTIASDLIIPDNTILYINNTTINVGRGVKIIIEPGGKLELNNSTLTNQCGYTWKGIEVWGVKNQQQNPYQGRFKAIHSTVEHAEQAVIASNTSSSSSSNNGGIIQAEYSNFINNRKSIVFKEYNHQSSSYFYSCNFKTDSDYRHSSTFLDHIDLFGVNSIKIKGCTFSADNNWAYSPTTSIGIRAINSSFSVGAHNTSSQSKITLFKHLNRAISTSKYYGSSSFSVRDSQFEENVFGIHTTAHNNFLVYNCFFKVGRKYVPGASSSMAQEGVTVMSGTGFQILHNNFQPGIDVLYPKTIGIRISGSGTENNEIYKNNFYKSSPQLFNLFYGNIANGLNRNMSNIRNGLKYVCNTNLNNQKGYDFTATNQGIAAYQGSWQQPAGNTFSHGTVANGSNLYSDFNNSTSTGNIVYYYKSTGQQKPVNAYQVAAYSVSNSHTCPYRQILDLDDDRGGGGSGGSELIELFSAYTNNQNQLNEHVAEFDKRIDNGKTSEIQTLIKNIRRRNYELVLSELNKTSPYLSYSTFETILERNQSFEKGDLMQLIVSNPDVFIDGVLLDTMEKLEIINEEDKAELKEKIANTATKRTEMEQSIADLEQKIHDVCNQAIRILHNHPTEFSDEDEITWLKRKNSVEAYLSISDIYLEKLEIEKALQQINVVKETFQLSDYQKEELIYFEQLKQIQYSILKSEQHVNNLDEEVIQNLKTIAENSNDVSREQAIILLNLNDENYFTPPVFPNEHSEKSEKYEDDNKLTVELNNKLKASPNPAISEVTFTYDVKHSGTSKLTILTPLGKQLKVFTIKDEKGSLTWNFKNLPSGIYYYGLFEKDNILVPYKKLIITK